MISKWKNMRIHIFIPTNFKNFFENNTSSLQKIRKIQKYTKKKKTPCKLFPKEQFPNAITKEKHNTRLKNETFSC